MRADVVLQEVAARFEELVKLADSGEEAVVLVNSTARALIATLPRRFANLHPGAIRCDLYQPGPKAQGQRIAKREG